MYRIIGADGKEYGPVPADQLRQWIAEGRANANSRVSLEGTAEWRTLGSFPEFAYLLSTVRLPAVFSPVPAQTNHPLATASMVMGILSLVFCFCCYGIPFNVLGLVFAITALFQIGADPQRYTGKGMALTGLILSLLSIILCLVFFVIMGLSSAWNTGPHHHKL